MMGSIPIDNEDTVTYEHDDLSASGRHHHGFVVVEECNAPQDGRPSNEFVLVRVRESLFICCSEAYDRLVCKI